MSIEVDDRREVRYLAQHCVEDAGGSVIVASNGQEAIEQLKLHPATDVVLMDLQMPVMDGYEATRRLRTLNFERPIIALTTQAMKQDRRRCLDAGCNDYLSRPLSRSRLLHLLAKYTADRPGAQSR